MLICREVKTAAAVHKNVGGIINNLELNANLRSEAKDRRRFLKSEEVIQNWMSLINKQFIPEI